MKKLYLIILVLQILYLNALAQSFEVSPSSLDFGVNTSGNESSKSFTVKNNSSEQFLVKVVDITESYITEVTPNAVTLDPGESQTFTVKIKYPATIKKYSYLLSLHYENVNHVGDVSNSPWINLETVDTLPPPPPPPGQIPPPTNVTLSCVTDKSVTINYNLSTSANVVEYAWTLKGNGFSYDSYGWTPYAITDHVTVNNLIPGKSYTFKIKTHDWFGYSPEVTIVFSTYTGSEQGTIKGPEIVCLNSQVTYSCDYIVGATYHWNTPGFTGSSTTNAINLTATGTSGPMEVYITKGCYTSNLSRYSLVHIGPPTNCSIMGPIQNCPNIETLYCASADGATNYHWYPSGMAIPVSDVDSRCINLYWDNVANGDPLWVQISNECGYVDQIISIDMSSCYYSYYSLSPNPASDNVELRISSNESSTQATNSSTLKSAKIIPQGGTSYSVHIINTTGALVYSAKKTENTFTIPVNNLTDGTYIVELNDGKQVYRKQLFVKH